MYALLTGTFVFCILAMQGAVLRRFGLRAREFGALTVGVILVGILLEGARLVKTIVTNVARPPEFDFLAFWLFGHVALQYHDVYDPHFFHLLGDRLGPSYDFAHELLDVGCVYPPPSLMWFLPLGFVHDPRLAIALWSIAEIVVMAAALIAVARLWSDAPSALDYLVVVALALAMHGTLENMAASQLVYAAVLCVASGTSARTSIGRGLWYGIALTVKPFLAFLVVGEMLQRRPWTFFWALATVVALTAAVAPALGLATIIRYVGDNPIARFPPILYLEPTNQSLLAWILRLTHAHPVHVMVAKQLPYLFVIGIVVASTIAVGLRHRVEPVTAGALFSTTGLFIYPQILTFYPVLLIVGYAALWRRRAELPGAQVGVASFIGLDVALGNFQAGHIAIFAVALMWLVLIIVARRDPTHELRRRVRGVNFLALLSRARTV